MKNKDLVFCKQLAKNPCALDEYVVVIIHNEGVYHEFTFGGLFESDSQIAERVYEKWCKEHNYK